MPEGDERVPCNRQHFLRYKMKSRFLLPCLIIFVACATDTGTELVASDDPPAEDPMAIIPASEISAALSDAPSREGPAPDTPDGIPHQQHNQNAPVDMQEALKDAARELPGIVFEPTPYSFSGSVGWRLEESFAVGPAGSFIRDSREFGHQHVPADGSLHMLLPNEQANIALNKGWGVIHPLTNSISGENSEYVMIYGPRNTDELETIWIIAQISYYQARGESLGSD